MAVFGLILDNLETTKNFIKMVEENSKTNNVVLNPFTTKLKTVKLDPFMDRNKILVIVSIKPVYFNFTIIGWFMMIGSFFIWGLSYYALPGFILGSLGIFWRKEFYRFMFKLGLRKKKYAGRCENADLDYILDETVFRGD